MKKLLLSLAVLAGAAFTASADEVTFDFINNEYGMTRLSGMTSEYNANPQTVVNGPVTITLEGDKNSRLWSDGLRIYTGLTKMTFSVSGGTISQIEFTAKAAKGGANIALAEGQTGSYDGASTETKISTWTGDAASVSFVSKVTKGNQAFGEMKVTYTLSGEAKKNADLKFDGIGATVYLGEKTFEGLALTKATTADVVYSSSDETVATVDPATGVVTLLTPGETTIEAKAEENDEYYAGSVSYALTVLSDDVVYINACTSDECGFTSVYADGSFNPWSIDATYGLKASAFKSSKCNPSDAVMVSPVIDLTERQNCTLSFEHALNQFKLNNELLETVDAALEYVSVVAREDGATEWTKLSNPLLPEAYSWDYVNSGDIDLSAFDGKNVEIGFRYISTAEIAGTWEIKNVLVKGAKASGVGIVDSIVDENAPAEYYSLQGVRLANPEKGQLVIVRKGNKAFKAIL